MREERPGVECLTFTVEQAGEALGIGRNLAYEAVERGEIPSVKIGRRVLVPRAALEEMLRSAAMESRKLAAQP
jgi:excisionase family DNA binding protein